MNASSRTDMATASAVSPAAPEPAKPKRARRRILMLSLPLALLLGAGGWWLSGGRYETTDNAYLHEARVAIAAGVPGRVVTVAIADNRPVKAGDVLFAIDPVPYELARDQAAVAVSQSRLSVEQLKLNYQGSLTSARLAEDEAVYQGSELTRQEALGARGVASGSTLDDARHAAQKALDQQDLARQSVAMARAALGGDPDAPTDAHPTVRAALVTLQNAEWNLAQATVRAPGDGVIYQASSFKPGRMVAAGEDLFSLVETGDVWVEANFKETQLDGIRVGQPAEVAFDAAPGKPMHAVVDAIGAGTGAEFSLLPAQNATGNWVKVTQRVPVRLRLAGPLPEQGLASGLSASVSVDTGRSRSLSDLLPAAWAGN